MRIRRRLVYWGDVPIKRNAVPQLLADISVWPTVDATALPEEDKLRFEAAREALRLFVEAPDVSLLEIQRRTGIHPEQQYRNLAKCICRAEDGRILGFRALLPRKHIKSYKRSAPVVATRPRGKGGAAGAFQTLLNAHRQIERWLIDQATKRVRPINGRVREVGRTVRRIHKNFLEKLREVGVTNEQYPFNRDLQAYRSLQRYLAAHAARFAHSAATEEEGAPPAVAQRSMQTPLSGLPEPVLPFDAVQFDGHKIDLRLTVRIQDPLGYEMLLQLTRIYLLIVIDVITRAVLGYHIALSSEYDIDDIACALQACFGPRVRKKLTIPGLKIRDGGGFPSELFEVAQYPAWQWFQFDSAATHLAEATLERLTGVVGCYTNNGRLREPDDRAIMERFFATVAANGLHRAPGSTGSSTNDETRRLADVGDRTELLMTDEELHQVIEVMLADYNGESHNELNGRSPIEAMRYLLDKPGVRVPQLPSTKRRQMIFLQEARIVPVRGSKNGVHVNFEGVRYSSEILRRRFELLGKKVRIYFNALDVRTLDAFFEDGSELGVLVAAKAWARQAHSIRLRKEILRLRRLGKLRYRDGEDAIESYTKYKLKQAQRDKRAATQLAEALRNKKAFGEVAVGRSEGTISTEAAVESEASVEAGKAEDVSPQVLKIRKTVVFGR